MIIYLARLKKERPAAWFVFIRELDNGDKFTIMVSKRIISLYGDELPEDDQERKIKGGPLYDRDHVLRLVKDVSISAWTRKCGSDIRRFELDLEDVAELIRTSLDGGKFQGSEWCEQKKNASWAACDAYAVLRLEWIDAAYKRMPIEYYVKFAINKPGKLLLVASCHPYSF